MRLLKRLRIVYHSLAKAAASADNNNKAKDNSVYKAKTTSNIYEVAVAARMHTTLPHRFVACRLVVALTVMRWGPLLSGCLRYVCV